VVIVTHELASIFAIGTNSVFLDADSKTMIAQGDPKQLLETTQDPKVQTFLTRGPRMQEREGRRESVVGAHDE
jgi:phospholipid/cholesterol/gamma-HCH transport system ATP-binding protein